MSTPADQIVPADANAGVDPVAAMGMPGEDMSWITDFHIDDTIVPIGAPLPEADKVSTDKPVEAVAEASTKPGDPVIPADAKADAAPEAGLETKPDVAEPDKAVAKVDDLSPEEQAIVNAAPEAERPAVTSKLKRSYFMDHFLNPEKPKEEVRAHLAEKSPSQYAEFETAVIAHNLAKPDEFCRDLYARDHDSYGKLATEVYKADPKFFAKQVTGRDGVDPDTVKTALDFYERNKDVISDDEPLSALDEETLAEMEKYFPEKVPVLKAQLEAAQKLKTENDSLKAAAKPDEAVDPKIAEAQQQAEAARVENEIWDVARDTVGDFIEQKALSSAGIAVTAEERTAAPMVALLKDFKAQVLFFGLNVDGKQLIPSFHEGFTAWGKEREPFKQAITHMAKFASAHEKDNVVDIADG